MHMLGYRLCSWTPLPHPLQGLFFDDSYGFYPGQVLIGPAKIFSSVQWLSGVKPVLSTKSKFRVVVEEVSAGCEDLPGFPAWRWSGHMRGDCRLRGGDLWVAPWPESEPQTMSCGPHLPSSQVQVVELKVTWITKSFCPGGTDSASPPPSVITQENLGR